MNAAGPAVAVDSFAQGVFEVFGASRGKNVGVDLGAFVGLVARCAEEDAIAAESCLVLVLAC